MLWIVTFNVTLYDENTCVYTYRSVIVPNIFYDIPLKKFKGIHSYLLGVLTQNSLQHKDQQNQQQQHKIMTAIIPWTNGSYLFYIGNVNGRQHPPLGSKEIHINV